MGIFGITPGTADTQNDGIQRIRADFYCEEIRFKPGDGIWAKAPGLREPTASAR